MSLSSFSPPNQTTVTIYCKTLPEIWRWACGTALWVVVHVFKSPWSVFFLNTNTFNMFKWCDRPAWLDHQLVQANLLSFAVEKAYISRCVKILPLYGLRLFQLSGRPFGHHNAPGSSGRKKNLASYKWSFALAALWYVRHLHYPGLIGRFFAYRHSGSGKYFLRRKEEIRGGLEGHSRCSMRLCLYISHSWG